MSSLSRSELIFSLRQTSFDLIIIGGGINGAGILRDASMRGLKCVLFEKDDYASGTSSKSSKLIHGGLRYLETFDWKLVFEASQERKVLLNIAPQIVHPLPFVYPAYKNISKPLWQVAAGVWLYDVLSLFHNVGHPKIWGKERTLKEEPKLKAEGLVGSALYYDAVTNDAKLTVKTLESGLSKGGMALNHCEAVSLLEKNGEVIGVEIQDHVSNTRFEVKGKWVVNVTGPWSDSFLEKTIPPHSPHLRPTKGVHLVVSAKRFPTEKALLLHAPQDGRVTFVIPWEGEILLGTTDTDFTGSPDDVTATREDMVYLLEISNYYFPTLKLTQNDILRAFAGLRPLLRDDRGGPSQTSREHKILFEKKGLVSLVGGKLTTHRKMSEQLIDEILKREPDWKHRVRPCTTRTTPL